MAATAVVKQEKGSSVEETEEMEEDARESFFHR